MLIRPADLARIRDGEIDLAFRRWDRPRVLVGTKMRTSVGLIEVTSVDRVRTVTKADAARAGGSRDQLLKLMAGKEPAPIWRIGVRFAGADPRIALRRALTEMGQLFGSIIAPGCAVTAPRYLREWWDSMPTFPDPYLMPGDGPVRTPDSYHYTPHADLRDDVADITRLMSAHNLELLVLDQTRPDIGLPVVKVVVPGLRSHRTRLAPGRLYDVPVALGLRDAPAPYRSLNPVPLFI